MRSTGSPPTAPGRRHPIPGLLEPGRARPAARHRSGAAGEVDRVVDHARAELSADRVTAGDGIDGVGARRRTSSCAPTSRRSPRRRPSPAHPSRRTGCRRRARTRDGTCRPRCRCPRCGSAPAAARRPATPRRRRRGTRTRGPRSPRSIAIVARVDAGRAEPRFDGEVGEIHVGIEGDDRRRRRTVAVGHLDLVGALDDVGRGQHQPGLDDDPAAVRRAGRAPGDREPDDRRRRIGGTRAAGGDQHRDRSPLAATRRTMGGTSIALNVVSAACGGSGRPSVAWRAARQPPAVTFPAVDGLAEVMPPDATGTCAVVSFTGHACVLTDLPPSTLDDLELDGYGAATRGQRSGATWRRAGRSGRSTSCSSLAAEATDRRCQSASISSITRGWSAPAITAATCACSATSAAS